MTMPWETDKKQETFSVRKKIKTTIKTGIIVTTVWIGLAIHFCINGGKRHEV